MIKIYILDQTVPLPALFSPLTISGRQAYIEHLTKPCSGSRQNPHSTEVARF